MEALSVLFVLQTYFIIMEGNYKEINETTFDAIKYH